MKITSYLKVGFFWVGVLFSVSILAEVLSILLNVGHTKWDVVVVLSGLLFMISTISFHWGKNNE